MSAFALSTISPSVFPRENYVVCKIVRPVAEENEFGIVISQLGVLFGNITEITNPDGIVGELQPLLSAGCALPDIKNAWNIRTIAVVGGFYCDIAAENEVLNPLGEVTRPDRGHKFGIIDYAKAPNGLLYRLGLANEAGGKCDIAYFDPETDIKHSRLTRNSRIYFNIGAKSVPRLRLLAETKTETTGWGLWRKHRMIAQRPLGHVTCYTRGDIGFFKG